MRLSPRLVAVACALGAAPALSHAGIVDVDLELSLLVDVSGSINAAEFGLQRGGYSAAFRTPGIQSQITGTTNGRLGKIAVNLVYWSGASEQAQVVGWTLLDSAAACNAFADAIDGTARPFDGQTAVGSVLNFATPLFASNSFEGFRKVIDISSDGELNDGAPVGPARANALANIDAINALVIGDNALLNYYTNNVIGGDGAFAIQSPTFETFRGAIFDKLTFEIPAPGAAALLGLGGLVSLRRRR
jgi:uncharacterized protein (TIGR03382 family)